MPNLLLLEDHELSRVNLEQNLAREGFRVQSFATGLAAMAFLESVAAGTDELPEVAVLDRSLPDLDGLEVMRRIRATPALQDMSVLMLTARAEELDRVLGLELGADDYIAKPFSFPELLARIRAISRRNRPRADPSRSVIQRGPLRVDLESFTATLAGNPVELTRREFELLVFLLKHPGQALSRQQLLRQVWKQPHPDENRTVDVHVRRLRAKLGIGLSDLETLVGIGYRLGGG